MSYLKVAIARIFLLIIASLTSRSTNVILRFPIISADFMIHVVIKVPPLLYLTRNIIPSIASILKGYHALSLRSFPPNLVNVGLLGGPMPLLLHLDGLHETHPSLKPRPK